MKTKLEITQVVNGLEYKGTLSLGVKKFLFVLRFGVHIDELDGQTQPTNKEQAMKFARELFQFSLKYSDQEILIDDQLLMFLFSVIVIHVIVFYNNPQSQGLNESCSCGQLLDRTSGLSSALGVSMSIGTTVELDVPDGDIPISLLM